MIFKFAYDAQVDRKLFCFFFCVFSVRYTQVSPSWIVRSYRYRYLYIRNIFGKLDWY